MPTRRYLRTMLFAAILLPLAAAIAQAAVRLPGIFSDRMVLQRDAPIHIWGWADPGEQISVRLGNGTSSTNANDVGRWSVYLPPLPSGGPAVIAITGKNTIKLSDVLIGDVWVASGQSNMEMPLSGFSPGTFVKDGSKEISQATHPQIRLFMVPRRSSPYRTDDVASAWTICAPETAKDFSAVAYFFGREISAQEKVPVGLIDATWGGTPAEAWISFDGLASDASIANVFLNWADFADQQSDAAATLAREAREDADAESAGKPKPQHSWHPDPASWMPGGLFNGMIAPMTPFSIRGVIWYQGESNSRADRAPLYARVFPDLIADWRSEWKQGDFPFFYVQISSFRSSPTEVWGVVRDAQRRTLSTANTGMAVTIDVGDPDNVHPADKQTVGHRLALLARAQVYGESIEANGPLFQNATPEGSSMRVWFEHASKTLGTSDGGAVQGFELAGEDHKFAPAQARIEGKTVVASNPEIKNPVYIRYAWANVTTANLVNSYGLPASTFTNEERLAAVTLLPTAH